MTIKIMVVDDDLAIGKLILYQLSSLGYQAFHVIDGLMALQRLPVEQPDLILLDVMLPAMSGWEICRHIRSASTVPIIMLTAKASDDDVVTGLNAGADDYLAKPFTITQLHARIEAVLRRASWAASRSSGNEPTIVRPISAAYAVPPPPRPEPVAPATPARPAQQAGAADPPVMPLRLGQRFREARQARGLTLMQVERVCKIRWEFLQAIEQENFAYVPRAQLRAVLTTYANYLGVNMRESSAQSRQQPFPLEYAAVTAVLLLLIAVSLYLLRFV